MEVLGFIFIGFVVLMIIGSIDNARPITQWSNEKLDRMYGKLIKAGQFEKANNVRTELERRAQERLKVHGNKKLSKDVQDELIDAVAQLAPVFAKKAAELVEKTMRENRCNESQANKIIGNRIKELENQFISQGFSKDDAEEKAMKIIFNIDFQ